jgi:CRISPR/Cas system type I-B associated protein Csh2 (Cas7 group RAMP superfamily)
MDNTHTCSSLDCWIVFGDLIVEYVFKNKKASKNKTFSRTIHKCVFLIHKLKMDYYIMEHTERALQAKILSHAPKGVVSYSVKGIAYSNLKGNKPFVNYVVYGTGVKCSIVKNVKP